MPRIYRPETDAQRTQALGAAKTKSDAVTAAGGTLAFSAGTLARLNTFLPGFITEMAERGSARTGQTAASAAADPARSETRMYISHFFQVFNLGVDRGVYPATDRGHYQLPVNSDKLPTLTSDDDLLQWANNINVGEANRVAAGGAAMVNPSAAEVDAKFTALQPLLANLTTAKDTYDSEQEDVAALREEADDIIADIWDEVLFTFRKDDAPSMRRKAREYGVVYRLTPTEEPSPSEFSVQGQVTDTDSNPLAEVQVTVDQTSDSVLTDANGEYLLPFLAPGDYTVTFTRADLAPQTLPVTVVEGEIATLDVVMETV